MGSMSLIHWIIVGAVLLLLFGGKNKISDVMGDVAKGIKSFKKGLNEDDDHPAPRPADRQVVEPPRAEPIRNEPMRTLDQYPPREPVAHAETSEPRKAG